MSTYPPMHPRSEEFALVVQTYHDGSQREIYVTPHRRTNPHAMIVSKTDTKGIINYVNEAFVEVSGYTEEELLGQPQNILRHPDMPRVVFKHMWETISRGETWTGNVKNLCADGGYYWVNAVITPIRHSGNIVGYNSVRRWLSDEEIAKTEELYSQLRSAA